MTTTMTTTTITTATPFRVLRALGAAAGVLAVAAGCSTFQQPAGEASQMSAFSAQMTGANEVPPNGTTATGTLYAVLNRQTNLLRWKMSYNNLSGPAIMAHFHGPAAVGANAGVVLPFANPVASPYEGSATLTPQQAADLLAGRWYANVHTARFPGGEIRGQVIEKK